MVITLMDLQHYHKLFPQLLGELEMDLQNLQEQLAQKKLTPYLIPMQQF